LGLRPLLLFAARSVKRTCQRSNSPPTHHIAVGARVVAGASRSRFASPRAAQVAAWRRPSWSASRAMGRGFTSDLSQRRLPHRERSASAASEHCRDPRGRRSATETPNLYALTVRGGRLDGHRSQCQRRARPSSMTRLWKRCSVSSLARVRRSVRWTRLGLGSAAD
jgi:hypothetical protein